MPTQLKIPFGLFKGTLVTPSEVKNGLACECICSGCFGRLIANHSKSNKRRNYFSHYSSDNCNNGYESALHLAAKRVLIESKEILVPEISASSYKFDLETHAYGEYEKKVPETLITLDSVIEEARDFDGIVPDIIAVSKGKTLFIEIAVTHLIDEFKLDKLKRLQIPTIEIKLNPSNTLPTLEEIKDLVVFNQFNRKWVFNSKQYELEQLVEYKAAEKLEFHRNRIIENQQKIQIKNQHFKELSDKKKLDLLLKELNLTLPEIHYIIGKDVNGKQSFSASSTVWQLSIYHKFIHCSIGKIFNKADVLKYLSERLTIKEIFPESAQIAIHYYLKHLQELKIIDYNSYSKDYFVEKDIRNDYPI